MPLAARTFGVFFVAAGLLHFLVPRFYLSIMPEWLPAQRTLVYASGVAEIAGGLGVLHPRTRRPAAFFCVATLVAIFPANVDMALRPERHDASPLALWLRLPLQALLVLWALAAARDTDRATEGWQSGRMRRS